MVFTGCHCGHIGIQNNSKKSLLEFYSIIMQNLRTILPLFCTPTWPSHHVSDNRENYSKLGGCTLATIGQIWVAKYKKLVTYLCGGKRFLFDNSQECYLTKIMKTLKSREVWLTPRGGIGSCLFTEVKLSWIRFIARWEITAVSLGESGCYIIHNTYIISVVSGYVNLTGGFSLSLAISSLYISWKFKSCETLKLKLLQGIVHGLPISMLNW